MKPKYLSILPSFVFSLICSFIFISCNPTKTLKSDEFFLQKVKITTDNKKVDKDELYRINKQKPNKKILGVFRFHLGAYNFFYKKVDKFKNTIGEPPAIYDSTLTQSSAKQIGLYLKNRGYFHNNITYTTKTRKNKVKLYYHVTTGTPYTINELTYNFKDPNLGGYVLYKKENTLIKPGKNFDVDILDKERERIKKILKERGYYYFSNNFIKYKVDSTIGNNKVNIELQLLNNKLKDNDNNYIETSHEKYTINDINLLIGKNIKNQNTYNLDTASYQDIRLFFDGKLRFKPKMLRHAIDFKPKETYSLVDQNTTYKHLSELRLFRNISIQYEEVDSSRLNSNIYLTPLASKSFALEGIGTNTGGDLGVEGNIIYQNKNLFRGGERLTVKLKGGLEIQRIVSVSVDENEIFGSPFNTIEFGPEVSLEFPRFLLPFNLEKFSKRANPRTTISTTLNFQQRPEYSRNLAQFSFGYFWNETAYKKHFITPFNISYIKLNLTPEFQSKIDSENNPFLKNSYTDHFISAIQYSFIFNNQEINKVRNFAYFKYNFETSGNLLSTINQLSNNPKNELTGAYDFLGIRYAEYFKTEFDFRHYTKNKVTSFVKRIAVGIGKPYGNLNVLPFEKSFFAGGSNGIRAWQARSLGPGSLPDSLTSTVNQIGELKIEANLEYRFDITKIFEGAFFIDAGNIWILKEDPQRPNAEIDLNRFYQDLAIGFGTGLRLDFSFFIIRFDLATPLKDPSSDNPKEYRVLIKNSTLNLGIGYPF
ncbi:MAG: BamA/TamA family outer membrane protein [Flavobacteriales bacterium]|nr:BamA/TamA family outer membrane protein [Flavobacteriales bacterium]